MIGAVRMSENAVNTIRDFLTKMELNFSYDEEKKSFILPYTISDKRFSVYVNVGDPWITIVALLARAQDLPSNVNKEALYARLLQDTFYLNEVTFGLTKDGDIVVHAEAHVNALTFEDFNIEFQSVVYGISHFIDKIMKDFPVKPAISTLYV